VKSPQSDQAGPPKRGQFFKKLGLKQINIGPLVFEPETAAGIITLLAIATALGVGSLVWASKSRLGTGVETQAVQVFVPDPTRATDGAFYQDGLVQVRGFEKAKQDAEALPRCLTVVFQPIKREETADELVKRMQVLYEQGSTYFIMTMSGKVSDIKNHFGNWHAACVREGRRRPILVATVASAPDLADASKGILRSYIRSDEESALLAQFARWKLACTRVIVFFITRSARQADDTYGRRGMEVFRDRFQALGGSTVVPVAVTATTAKGEVERQMGLPENKDAAQTTMAIFVVGYGDMIRNTLSELVSQKFAGPILCASTLTEPDWQPDDKQADNRIFTVLPRLVDPRARLTGDDKNIVFFFAKKTLFRVLELTAQSTDSTTFIARWTAGEQKPQLDQEYLANGDTIVQLDVVGAEHWR
jgi:hypothetical protein